VSNALVLMAWSALYFGVKYQRDLQAQQRRTLRAETLAREAQLDMLRYQLNPHFLFNTLNTLRALIGDDDQRAKRIVTELSDFLRYSLLDLNAPTVPLKEEVDVTRTYLAIEKIRFEERLQVEVDVDPAVASRPVPPFLVHSLVENAVKHGMATSPRPLQIRLKAEPTADGFQIEVANTGYLADPSTDGGPPSNGIGLKNVRQRLEQLFPTRHVFTLTEADGWVRARVGITESITEPILANA
jgi:LytS/YehU family sensor histidine kinase